LQLDVFGDVLPERGLAGLKVDVLTSSDLGLDRSQECVGLFAQLEVRVGCLTLPGYGRQRA
jgi:hypothetical protein